MSLVNQMLQDLDHRHACDAPTYVLPEGGTAQPRKSWLAAIPRGSPWEIGLVIASATLFFMWQQANRTPDDYYYIEAGQALKDPAGSLVSITPGYSDALLEEVPTDAAEFAGLAVGSLASITPGSASPHEGERQFADAQPAIGPPAQANASIGPPAQANASIGPPAQVNDSGIPGLDPALIEPAPVSSARFSPSHGLMDLRQLLLPEATGIVRPTKIAKKKTADDKPKTTRLSNTIIEHPDSSLRAHTTLLDALDKSIISKNNDLSNISIKPAGGAATRSYKKARLLLDNGQGNEAKDELQRTLVFDPGHKSAREILVALLLQHGDELGAESVIDTGITYSPRHSPFTQLKARILSSRGETQAAIDTMELVAPDRRHQIAHSTMLAALYQKSGNHEKAIRRYLALIESNPQESTLWSGLAISLDSQGQYKAAMKAYKQALEDRQLSSELRRYAEQRVHAIKSENGGENS